LFIKGGPASYIYMVSKLTATQTWLWNCIPHEIEFLVHFSCNLFNYRMSLDNIFVFCHIVSSDEYNQ